MILLLLIALDLGVADPNAAAPRDLSVELTIAGSEYTIVHRYTGAAPRRFATGSTDKNCDEPVDVLRVNGSDVRLFSEKPCGGFAFRAARVVKPGESWTIRGHLPFELHEGDHELVARYCATAETLKMVDPAFKRASGPPWWLGCAESPTDHVRLKK